LADYSIGLVNLSRKPQKQGDDKNRWVEGDITAPGFIFPKTGGVTAFVHMAPIWLLPPLMDGCADSGINRIVVFGSTSIFGKSKSRSRDEADLVEKMKQAEKMILESARVNGIEVTILRPTMIYGGANNKNVEIIKNSLQKSSLFPLAGGGRGLRSPVHADDLAMAVLSILGNKKTFGKCYNLSGGESLSYADMVRRIGESAGIPARFIHIPLPLYRTGLKLLSTLPGYRFLDPSMADRQLIDLVYENGEVIDDFGYAPRMFEP
jgi:nucleoside-diphosphate-sugar epimerase